MSDNIPVIRQYLKFQTYPPATTANQKRAVRKVAKNYRLTPEDQLYRCILKDGQVKTNQLVVDSREDQLKILQECHDSCGHKGVTSVINSISSRYYWPNWSNEVKEYCLSCEQCQKTNITIKAKPAENLHPIPVPKDLWRQWGIDYIGPFNETPRGNKYIISATDYFSKWPEAWAVQTNDAITTANFLFSLYCRYGAADIIISDRGSHFCNQVMAEMHSTFNVQHRVSTPYHPQTNGLQERTNQTLVKSLQKMAKDDSDWDLHLKASLFGHRQSTSRVTKSSPFEIAYGRPPTLAMQLQLEKHQTPQVATAEMVNSLNSYRDSLRDRVHSNIQKTQQKMKIDHQKKVAVKAIYKVGDIVYKRNARKLQTKQNKLKETNWLGPYQIVKMWQTGVVTLKDNKGNILKQKVSVSHLKQQRKRPTNLASKPPSSSTASKPPASKPPSSSTASKPPATKPPSSSTASKPPATKPPSSSTASKPPSSSTASKPPSSSTASKPPATKPPSSSTASKPPATKPPATKPPSSSTASKPPSSSTASKPPSSSTATKPPSSSTACKPPAVKPTPPPALNLKIASSLQESIGWKLPPYIHEETLIQHLRDIFEKVQNEKLLIQIIDQVISSDLPVITHPSNIYKSREDLRSSFIQEMEMIAEPVMDSAIHIVTPAISKLTSNPFTQVSAAQLTSATVVAAYLWDCPPSDVLQTLKSTPDHLEQIQKYPTEKDQHTQLQTGNSMFSPTDLSPLDGDTWLDDKVIHTYLSLLSYEQMKSQSKEVFVLPCFLLNKWLKKDYRSWLFPDVSFSAYTYIMMPVCQNQHWSLLVADTTKKTVTHLDSMGSPNPLILQHWRKYMFTRERYFPEGLLQWTSYKPLHSLQTDGSSCGVFVLMYAESILRGVSLPTMRQVHVSFYRSYVKTRIMFHAVVPDKKICSMPFCCHPANRIAVQCTQCHLWFHHKCGNTSKKEVKDSHVCLLCSWRLDDSLSR